MFPEPALAYSLPAKKDVRLWEPEWSEGRTTLHFPALGTRSHAPRRVRQTQQALR